MRRHELLSLDRMFVLILKVPTFQNFYPPEVPKAPSPVRFGILGAAAITLPALVIPAKSHPEVVLKGVAARDRARAEALARTHGIERVYDSYDGQFVLAVCLVSQDMLTHSTRPSRGPGD